MVLSWLLLLLLVFLSSALVQIGLMRHVLQIVSDHLPEILPRD